MCGRPAGTSGAGPGAHERPVQRLGSLGMWVLTCIADWGWGAAAGGGMYTWSGVGTTSTVCLVLLPPGAQLGISDGMPWHCE